MAGTRISLLPSAATLTGTELVPITQNGSTVRTTVQAIASTNLVGVSSFSAGTTGLTPSTPSTGGVILGGTLAIANGGTGQTTASAALNALGGAPLNPPVRSVTDSTVLQLSDAGGTLVVTSSSATTVSIPANAFSVGAQVLITSMSTGIVSILPINGSVTAYSSGGRNRISGQYSIASLVQVSSNVWVIGGDIIV